MRPDSRLRRRLATALLATAAATVSLLPFTFGLIDSLLEEQPLRDLLGYEHLNLIHRGDVPFEVDTELSSLRYYRPAVAAAGESLPPELAPLAPGVYHEFPINGRDHNVQVREIAPGDRSYLAYDIAYIEETEEGLFIFIHALAILIVLAVWVFGRRVVDRALYQLDELLKQIGELVPGQGGQRLNLSRADPELRVIVDALNHYMGQLDALVKRERFFAAAANHELRTPLSVIQGSAALVAQNPQVPERLRQRLTRAVREICQDLDALLALSQNRESPPGEALRLDEYLPLVSEIYLLEAHPAARVRWIAPQPVPLSAPPGAVNVVFGNLLRNALRAAQGQEEVVVEIVPGRVSVSNGGPGIPENELPHLFEPQFRGRDGGSGMGLYIAMSLARRHSWTITLANRAEGGVRADWSFASGPSA